METKYYKLDKYAIKLVRWNDEYGNWRLGLNWNSENDFVYICEKPTVEECLDSAIEYVENLKGEIDKKIYVVGIKARGDAPALWIDIKDTKKMLESKTITGMLETGSNKK